MGTACIVAYEVQAFVLWGFTYSSPLATPAERRTKVEILFKSSIVKVKLGQKAEQRTER